MEYQKSEKIASSWLDPDMLRAKFDYSCSIFVGVVVKKTDLDKIQNGGKSTYTYILRLVKGYRPTHKACLCDVTFWLVVCCFIFSE